MLNFGNDGLPVIQPLTVLCINELKLGFSSEHDVSGEGF